MKVKGARVNAATLRCRTAGSRDESRCGAIHKFNGGGDVKNEVKVRINVEVKINVNTSVKIKINVQDARLKQKAGGRYKFKGNGESSGAGGTRFLAATGGPSGRGGADTRWVASAMAGSFSPFRR